MARTFLTKSEITKAYQDYMAGFPFQWFLTIRLPNTNYRHYLGKICYKIFLTNESGQIGYMGIFVNGKTGPHLHIAMLGRFRDGKTLFDLDIPGYEKQIGELVRDKKGCKIETIFDLSGAAGYAFCPRNMLSDANWEFIPPWGRILKKAKRI